MKTINPANAEQQASTWCWVSNKKSINNELMSQIGRYFLLKRKSNVLFHVCTQSPHNNYVWYLVYCFYFLFTNKGKARTEKKRDSSIIAE